MRPLKVAHALYAAFAVFRMYCYRKCTVFVQDIGSGQRRRCSIILYSIDQTGLVSGIVADIKGIGSCLFQMQYRLSQCLSDGTVAEVGRRAGSYGIGDYTDTASSKILRI